MGIYTTKPLDSQGYKDLIDLIRKGYIDNDGHKHRPNNQLATILVLQGNLGCRIGDIVNLEMENIEWDGEAWRLNLSEQKTGKKRYFIIPTPVKEFIDRWTNANNITHGRLFDITKQDVWFHLRPATAYLGLDKTSCHSLRKAAAIRVYEDSGKDISVASSFLNHSNPSTTLIYLKRTSKQMDDVLSQSVALA